MSDEETVEEGEDEVIEGPPPGYVPAGGFAGSETVGDRGEVILTPPEPPEWAEEPAEDEG